MINSNTEQKIRQVVNGFVQKGFMFTVYDVTRFLRKGGNKLRHHDVHEIVEKMYADGEFIQYTRDTMDVGAPVNPFVYHHPYADLNKYEQTWVDSNVDQIGMKNDNNGDTGTVQATAPVADQDVSQTTKVEAPEDGYSITKEGRLNISPEMVDEIADGAYSELYVVNSNGKILVKASTADGDKEVLGRVGVNNDGRVRVCKSFLCKISQGNLFKVNLVKGEAIEIAPY